MNLTQVLGPLGTKYVYAYDTLGDVIKATDPFGLTPVNALCQCTRVPVAIVGYSSGALSIGPVVADLRVPPGDTALAFYMDWATAATLPTKYRFGSGAA